MQQVQLLERDLAPAPAEVTEQIQELEEDVASEAPIAARLVVIDGQRAGETFAIRANAPATIGSRSQCDIVLQAEDDSISPEEARIWPRGDKFMFHSLSPTMKATVQGKPFVWLVLADGDVIEVGPFKLRFEVLPQPV
jgi:hypothetical protein